MQTWTRVYKPMHECFNDYLMDKQVNYDTTQRINDQIFKFVQSRGSMSVEKMMGVQNAIDKINN